MTKTSNSSTSQKTKKSTSPRRFLSLMQKIGKSLLFPIAMLPFAAILLRMGAAIPQTGFDDAHVLTSVGTQFSGFIASLFLAIGNGVFGPALPFLFAIGVGFGMTKDQRGEAAITAFSVMIIFTILMSAKGGTFGGSDFVDRIYGSMHLNGGSGFHGVFGNAYNSILASNVFVGLVAGGLVAFLYNKFNGLELPSILGFFSGRRLIPVVSFIVTMFLGLVFAIVWPWFGVGLYYLGKGLGEAQGSHWGNAGVMGIFGFVNRLLIPFGLHHTINTPLWFSSVGGTQAGIDGDINIFSAAPALGNHSGTFQTGFFPTMMFGLPALAAAIWYNANGNQQKAKVASLFFGSALVSFFTGITEPIEFSFLFIAPALFLTHAILTGLFGFIVGAFGIQLGFGFSAGLVDYALSIPKSLDIIAANKSGFEAVMANPAWIWVIGAAEAATYFFVTNFVIKKWNISTPGRGEGEFSDEKLGSVVTVGGNSNVSKYHKDATTILKAVGGADNIISLSNCATRLRFVLKDNSKVDSAKIKTTTAMGQMKVADGYQVIMGPTVEMYANEIQDLIN